MREESVEAERSEREEGFAKRDRRFELLVLVGMWMQLVSVAILVKLAFCP